jgi:hypothetical protein
MSWKKWSVNKYRSPVWIILRIAFGSAAKSSAITTPVEIELGEMRDIAP